MSITREEVAKVALLARLQLDDDEIDAMTAHLSRIVEYVEQLSELDTDAVEPMAHAMDIANVFASDEVRASLDRGEALANAPNQDGEYYRVPAVLGEA